MFSVIYTGSPLSKKNIKKNFDFFLKTNQSFETSSVLFAIEVHFGYVLTVILINFLLISAKNTSNLVKIVSYIIVSYVFTTRELAGFHCRAKNCTFGTLGLPVFYDL
jgi:hypothetical protein